MTDSAVPQIDERLRQMAKETPGRILTSEEKEELRRQSTPPFPAYADMSDDEIRVKQEEVSAELRKLPPYEEADRTEELIIDHLLGEADALWREWLVRQMKHAYDAAVAGEHVAAYRILLAVKGNLEQTTKAAEIVHKEAS